MILDMYTSRRQTFTLCRVSKAPSVFMSEPIVPSLLPAHQSKRSSLQMHRRPAQLRLATRRGRRESCRPHVLDRDGSVPRGSSVMEQMRERLDNMRDGALPSPATHAMWTQLEAGETVHHDVELPKNL